MQEKVMHLPLPDGRFILVDGEDYPRLSQHKWFLTETGYPMRYLYKGRHQYTTVTLHRELLGFPQSDIDHRDRNLLNCQKSNLRLCTHSQNMANRVKQKKPASSRFKGVSSTKNGWRAQLGFQKRPIFLGNFNNELEASLAYDVAALLLFKDFARPTHPELAKRIVTRMLQSLGVSEIELEPGP